LNRDDFLLGSTVKRPISSTFWLYREILPYGENCVIVSPPEIRDQFRNKLVMLSDQYSD
jgi:predicted DNA-binding transcriptional regulator YafY